MSYDLATISKHLDDAHEELSSCDGQHGMELLVTALFQVRSAVPPSAWRDIVTVCRAHPLSSILAQDPLTHRSYTKPRGYAGDAPMLAMIYDAGVSDPSCSGAGKTTPPEMAARRRLSEVEGRSSPVRSTDNPPMRILHESSA